VRSVAGKRAKRDPSWNEDRITEFKAALSSLLDLAAHDRVIVEGQKDANSLRRLGVRAKVTTWRLARKLREVDPRSRGAGHGHRTVLLPDFDREGREKIKQWSRQLAGGTVDSSTWRRLFPIVRGEGVGVENIAGLAEKLGILRSDMWLGPDERVS